MSSETPPTEVATKPEPPPDSPLALRRRRAERRAGQVMLGVAAVGVLVAVVGTIVGWVLLGRLDRASRESLEVSIESLDSIDDTIDLADTVLTSTTETLGAVEESLGTVADSFDTTDAVLDDVAELAAVTGPALTDATATIDDLAAIGGSIDTVLDGLGRIPLAPDYDPDAGFGDTLARLSEDLGPVAGALTDLSESLGDSTTTVDRLQTDIRMLADRSATVTADLDRTETLLGQYRSNVADARLLAERTRDDLDNDLRWMRILLVIAGANFAVGQIVPYTIGRDRLRAMS